MIAVLLGLSHSVVERDVRAEVVDAASEVDCVAVQIETYLQQVSSRGRGDSLGENNDQALTCSSKKRSVSM